MPTDPRLLSTEFLAIAAYRLQQRRQAARTAPPDWRYSEGLASLLEAARHLPQRGPFELPDLQDCDGLARLLHDARAQAQEHRHGA